MVWPLVCAPKLLLQLSVIAVDIMDRGWSNFDSSNEEMEVLDNVTNNEEAVRVRAAFMALHFLVIVSDDDLIGQIVTNLNGNCGHMALILLYAGTMVYLHLLLRRRAMVCHGPMMRGLKIVPCGSSKTNQPLIPIKMTVSTWNPLRVLAVAAKRRRGVAIYREDGKTGIAVVGHYKGG